MYELKSKKTGRIQVVSDEELRQMGKLIGRFVVTKLSLKPLIPSLKEPPLEIKKPKNKK